MATRIAHDVYFTLNDPSPASRGKLVEACRRHLTGHAGEVWFACGVRCESLRRPVNDQEFDVGLHVVFEDRAAHDRYQVDPRHLQFVEENKAGWKKVRVFDTEC
jgi:hypothetical protein